MGAGMKLRVELTNGIGYNFVDCAEYRWSPDDRLLLVKADNGQIMHFTYHSVRLLEVKP